MMSFEAFQQQVITLLKDDKWMHILPSIEAVYRERFIHVLEAGVGMPLAFDLILITKDMTDEEFFLKWDQLKPRE